MEPEMTRVIEAVVKDKGIEKEIVVEALEAAMATAARKKYGADKDIEAHYNDDTGQIDLYEFREVVETVEDPDRHITLEDGQKLDPEATVGDSLGIQLSTEGLGRIAAQTAKQVIIQRVRDAEKDIIYDEYKMRLGEIMSGIVRRFERKDMIVDLGRTEAMLPMREQIPRETFRPGDRIRAMFIELLRESRGPQIILTRASPAFVVKLFEAEVPEISEGIVTIEAVAREAGSRTKIAVRSHDADVDPVGACVGMRGARVQAVVQELRGEKIDIIPWGIDIAENVVHALAPAEVARVIVDERAHSMDVIVPEDQLSLAIGRRGQNVRLAVELTGWDLNIKSEAEIEAELRAANEAFNRLEGVGSMTAQLLISEGFRSLEELIEASPDELAQLPGIGEDTARKIITSATALNEVMKQEAEERRLEEERLAEEEAERAAAEAAAAEEGGDGSAPADQTGAGDTEEAGVEAAADSDSAVAQEEPAADAAPPDDSAVDKEEATT